MAKPTLISAPLLRFAHEFSTNSASFSGSNTSPGYLYFPGGYKRLVPTSSVRIRSPAPTKRLNLELKLEQQRAYYREPSENPTLEQSFRRERDVVCALAEEHPLPKTRDPQPPSPTTSHERVIWLILYFTLNLALTLYNKSVLLHFPFPYTLSALHALFGVIGTRAFIHLWLGYPQGSSGRLKRKAALDLNPWLTGHESRILAAFSLLYAVNIIVSNVSLQLVTVPFHQVVRATTPVFTLLLAPLLRLPTRASRARIFALIPVVLGVGVATYGDYYFTAGGLSLTLLGTILAALKTLFTNLLQSPPTSLQSPPSTTTPTTPITTGPPSPHQPSIRDLKRTLQTFSHSTPRRALHPFALLYKLSPLAFIYCVFAAQFSGELTAVRAHMQSSGGKNGRLLALLANGAIAFALNVVSFGANGKVGAVNMSVAANVKQALTILLAVVLFDLHITGANAVGIVLTLAGGAWYARVEHVERGRR